MKRLFLILTLAWAMVLVSSCTETTPGGATNDTNAAAMGAGQSAVQDDDSQKNVLQIAIGSKDHSTLVAAVQAAGLEDALANAGPFTVFAPTNAAFDKVPKETLTSLLKPENKSALSNILEYHVYVGTIKTEQMRDGLKLNMVNLKNVVVSNKDGKITLNDGINILASVPAANGIVHVIDGVMLPPEK